MIEVRRYTHNDASVWDDFVLHSRQGTFLVMRGYMDYHSDRFADHSLMIYNDDKLYALLPANETDGTLYSHQGLTYGGLITDNRVTTANVLDVFVAINEYLAHSNINKVVYKAIPWIYHRQPSEEDLYAIFCTTNAVIKAREISSTILLTDRLPLSRTRRNALKRSCNNSVVVEQGLHNLAAFWSILDENLMSRHGVHPVHTITEMQLLASRFPNNIQLYIAKKDNVPIAGVLLYITPQVIHTQYIAPNADGRRYNGVDAIINFITSQSWPTQRYFDFGISTEDFGHYLNTSLIYQKEGFGARGVCYDTYCWEI